MDKLSLIKLFVSAVKFPKSTTDTNNFINDSLSIMLVMNDGGRFRWYLHAPARQTSDGGAREGGRS